MSTEAPAADESVIRDRYQLRSLLGHGGMGMVWSAHDRRLDRIVALKLLRPDVPESTAAQMEREARAAARVDDQRVVTVLDLDHMDDGRPFLVLEMHDGWTLAEELRDGPLHPERFQQLTHDLLGGLASAHGCGVMHRDIKPANVLAEPEGFRITDFGLASIDTDQHTEPNLMGTLAYIAPERLHGTPGTFAADVFSASVVLYEAASGSKPFQADTPADALMAVRSRRVTPLPDHVPEALASAIMQGLDPDPARRPADAGELLAAARGTRTGPEVHTVLDDPLEQTRPLDPLDTGLAPPDGTTTEMLRPRSGNTQSFDPVDADHRPAPRPSEDREMPAAAARSSVLWRRPALLVAAAVVLTFAFLLGVVVSDEGGSSQPTQPTGVTTAPATEQAPAADDASDPAQRLQETLAEIEELGR